jgi:RimJ/RimL family protein N-acetyltransferase
MIHELETTEYEKAWPLFRVMDHHLATQALLAGMLPGAVYVDDPSAPRAVLARVGHRLFLVGFERNDRFNEGLRRLFLETLYPQARAAGRVEFVLYYEPGRWERAIERILEGKFPMQDARHYYAFKELRHDWRTRVPPGFALRPVNRALLEGEPLGNLDSLVEEVLSEGPSVEHYLAHRFGFCVASRDEIAGWCLSENNWEDRCEVGIETSERYRRRGIATVTASALIEHALAQGVTTVGWHCYASNEESIATARTVGFEKVVEYPVTFAWFDEVANLAVNGNMHFWQGQYREALVWYERAFQAGQAPVWAYVNAASAKSLLGEREAAFRCLRQAIERGFDDVVRLKKSEHLKALHDSAEWKALVDRLEGEARPGGALGSRARVQPGAEEAKPCGLWDGPQKGSALGLGQPGHRR